MKLNTFIFTVFLSLFTLTILGGCSSASGSDGKSDSNSELKVGISNQPKSLDPHIDSAINSQYITKQIFESLVTINSEHEMVPQLAESVEESEDGKKITFFLREGVKFHDGTEMTADDVVASMNRWKENSVSGISQKIKEGEFKAKDDYTVVLELIDSSPMVLNEIAANLWAVIMPEEVIEEADLTGVKEPIGTGPFEFVEWKQDRNIHIKKYDDYKPVDKPSDGMSGKKEAMVSDIYFEIVPDSSTQISGIKTKQYDVILDVPNLNYEELNGNEDLNVEVSSYGHLIMLFNKHEGWFTDVNMRKAVNMALDHNKVLSSAFFTEDLYVESPSFMLTENSVWYNDAGSKNYYKHDISKAKDLLKESEYDGEEIKLLTTRDYPHIYNSSIAVQEQLEKVGINIKLEVYDFATGLEKRRDSDNWDLYISGYPEPSNPLALLYLNQDFFDGPQDDRTTELMSKMGNSATEKEAQEIWGDLQQQLWESLPVTKFGDFSKISVTTDNVEGYTYFKGPNFWNTEVKK